MRRVSQIALFITFGIVLFTGVAYAAEGPHESQPEVIIGGMSEKLVRGVVNVATGWLEFPRQISNTYKREGAVKGIFIGPLKGIGMTIVRTVTGAAEVVTFPLPYPGEYDPYLHPVYVWE